MPKPRSPDPSPAAVRMRAYRERMKSRSVEPETHGRLVRVSVWVPKSDEKAMRLAAERFRRAARIPESEVPE